MVIPYTGCLVGIMNPTAPVVDRPPDILERGDPPTALISIIHPHCAYTRGTRVGHMCQRPDIFHKAGALLPPTFQHLGCRGGYNATHLQVIGEQ